VYAERGWIPRRFGCAGTGGEIGRTGLQRTTTGRDDITKRLPSLCGGADIRSRIRRSLIDAREMRSRMPRRPVLPEDASRG